MKRKLTAIYRMSDRWNDDLVPGTPAERISLVWPLTWEITSFSKKHDTERRLQEHGQAKTQTHSNWKSREETAAEGLMYMI